MNHTKLNLEQMRRHGKYILLGKGYTAEEREHTLTIRRDSKIIGFYRFPCAPIGRPLTDQDKRLLQELVENC